MTMPSRSNTHKALEDFRDGMLMLIGAVVVSGLVFWVIYETLYALIAPLTPEGWHIGLTLMSMATVVAFVLGLLVGRSFSKGVKSGLDHAEAHLSHRAQVVARPATTPDPVLMSEPEDDPRYQVFERLTRTGPGRQQALPPGKSSPPIIIQAAGPRSKSADAKDYIDG